MRDLIHEGQKVVSRDGRKLGRVVEVGAQRFEVEHGFFLPEVHLLDFAHVDRVDGETVHLRLTGEAVDELWRLEENFTEPGERRRAAEQARRHLPPDAPPTSHEPR